MRSFAFVLAVVLAVLLAAPVQAQKTGKVSAKQAKAKSEKAKPEKARQADKSHILVVLDCSKSMWDTWQSDAKIKVTQTVLLRFVDSIGKRADIDMALRVFGHLNAEEHGSRLEVPFEPDNLYRMQGKIKALVPNGGCNAAEALVDALADFEQPESDHNIMIVITDGVDECAGNICQMTQQVVMSGAKVQTFIIGIGSKEDFQHGLSCAGHFRMVESEEQYTAALFDVLRLSSERAKVVLKLTDSDDLAYETTIPVVFYDSLSGAPRLTTLLQCQTNGATDTLSIDPLGSYNITLYTKPETTLVGCRFAANRTTTKRLRIDQGTLAVRMVTGKTTWTVPSYEVQVHCHEDVRVLVRQSVGDNVAYRSGFYDIEILTTPPTKLLGVEVRSDAATDLAIPAPGMLTISKGKQPMEGSIFDVENGHLTWVCDVDLGGAGDKQGERLLLMPGDYQIIMSPRQATDYKQVKSQSFKIKTSELKHLSF